MQAFEKGVTLEEDVVHGDAYGDLERGWEAFDEVSEAFHGHFTFKAEKPRNLFVYAGVKAVLLAQPFQEHDALLEICVLVINRGKD